MPCKSYWEGEGCLSPGHLFENEIVVQIGEKETVDSLLPHYWKSALGSKVGHEEDVGCEAGEEEENNRGLSLCLSPDVCNTHAGRAKTAGQDGLRRSGLKAQL